MPTRNQITIFSGGTAANSLVDVFEALRVANEAKLSYVIPISDNGGSSSELIRVFGGPGIGDVRSRLVRLIPSNNPESAAISSLFNHRLPRAYHAAHAEWLAIIEARHALWVDISSPKRELIRAYLTSINMEILRRLRPTSRFDFSGASIGNLFLTGARLFTGSFESAIYLLSSICNVPSQVDVLPALNTNFAHHIAALLEDGTIITGQNNISHPSAISSTATVNGVPATAETGPEAAHYQQEDAHLPGTLPSLLGSNPIITKDGPISTDARPASHPSRIQSLFYINPYGARIRHAANPHVLAALQDAKAVVYSPGSLFTSLVPSLILGGVGAAIRTVKTKVLVLNSRNDRETADGAAEGGRDFDALDFVRVVAEACVESQRGLAGPGTTDGQDGKAAVAPERYRDYVSHVVFMDVPGAPVVDRARLGSLGIESMRTYGRQSAMGEWRYNEVALEQVLEAIVGRARSKVPGKGTNVQRDSADEARTGEAGTQVQSGQTLAYGRRNTLVG